MHMTESYKNSFRTYTTQIPEISIKEFLEWLKSVDLILKGGPVSSRVKESDKNVI